MVQIAPELMEKNFNIKRRNEGRILVSHVIESNEISNFLWQICLSNFLPNSKFQGQSLISSFHQYSLEVAGYLLQNEGISTICLRGYFWA